MHAPASFSARVPTIRGAGRAQRAGSDRKGAYTVLGKEGERV